MKNEVIKCKSCGEPFTDIKVDDFNQCPYCSGISWIGKEDVEKEDDKYDPLKDKDYMDWFSDLFK